MRGKRSALDAGRVSALDQLWLSSDYSTESDALSFKKSRASALWTLY